VLQNVAFGLRARGTRRHVAEAAAAAWLDRVGLGDLAATRPAALSGGQAQRVALARALASDPALLLLDEPLAAVDVQARQQVRRALRLHLRQFAGPCLLVTHEPIEAVALANRLVVLEHGRIVQEGPVAEVARRPRSQWVAQLVGLNLYRGLARSGVVELDGDARMVAASTLTGPVFVVVHPRAVALHRRRPDGSPRNVWAGHVDGLEPQGDRVRVHVTGPLPIVAEVTPPAVASLDLAAGGEVFVSVKATEVELFED
jgi:molybdate transport system ATP-binding protein